MNYRPDMASHEEQDAAFCAAMLAAYPHFTPPPPPVPEANILTVLELQAVSTAKRTLETIQSAKAIIADIASQHGFTVEQILSPSRKPKLSAARMHAYYELRQTGQFSYKQIATFCARADHATPWHGAKMHAIRNGLPMPEVREKSPAKLGA